MCRIHDSATHTQVQGHSSRPYDVPLNFVSAPYLLYLWKGFHFGEMFISDLNETMSWTHDSAKQTQGQGYS